jgi:hypothetical protein
MRSQFNGSLHAVGCGKAGSEAFGWFNRTNWRFQTSVPKASKDVLFWDSWKSSHVRKSITRGSAMNAGLKKRRNKNN